LTNLYDSGSTFQTILQRIDSSLFEEGAMALGLSDKAGLEVEKNFTPLLDPGMALGF
jgi:hypothetical protein